MSDPWRESVDRRFDRVDARFDRVDGEIEGLKSDVRELKDDVRGLKGDVQELKGELREVKVGVADLDKRVGRLEVLYEVQSDQIKLIAEGQQDLKQHIDRRFEEEFRPMRLDLQMFVKAEAAAHEEFRRRFDNHEHRITTLEARGTPGSAPSQR